MSTLRVNTLQNTNTTNGGISINSSGHVTMDGVAYPSAGPLSSRNLIVNGAMAVSQRGTTESASGSSAYGSVDRFKRSVSGGTTASSQVALTSGSPYDEGFRFAFRYTNTDAVTSTATQHRYLEHKLEAQVMSQSGWDYPSSSSYITLSFWVRASVGQEYYANLRTTDGTGQYYIISTGTLTANTWTKVTKTIPGNSNLTFDNNNDVGLTINWFPFAGTDWTDSGATLDTWATWDSTARVPDMTTTWGTTAGATFDITGVQLEVGQVATPFEHRSYGDELARCQRYYYILASGNGESINNLAAYNTTQFYGIVRYPTMRADPSIDITTGTNYYVAYGNGTAKQLSGINSLSAVGPSSCNIYITSSGLTQGTAWWFESSNNSAKISLQAEL